MHSLDPIPSCLLKDFSLPFFNVSLPTGSFHQPVNMSPDFTDRQTDRSGLHIPPTSVPSSSELSPGSLSHPNISEKSPTQGRVHPIYCFLAPPSPPATSVICNYWYCLSALFSPSVLWLHTIFPTLLATFSLADLSSYPQLACVGVSGMISHCLRTLPGGDLISSHSVNHYVHVTHSTPVKSLLGSCVSSCLLNISGASLNLT